MSAKKQINKPQKSEKLAWFLGALAGDGYVSKKARVVKLSVTQKDFAQEFKKVGEELFHINSSFYHRVLKNKNHNDVYEVAFYSVALSNWIGDFKGDVWHETIQEKYDWILKKSEYKIAFLNGYFDSEGSVQDVSESKSASKIRCRISIGYWEPAYFFKEILNSLNIDSNFYLRPSTGIVKDIVINNAENVINFCNLIESSIDYKQKRINYIKKIKIIDSTEFIKKLYQRYQELIKDNGYRNVYEQLLSEGYGKNKYYNLSVHKIRNWTYSGHNPLNQKGHHCYQIIFPED